MPSDEQRPIRYSVHALVRMEARKITEAEVEQVIRHGAWQAGGLGSWRSRASVAGRSLDVVFAETEESLPDGKVARVIEVLLVVTVIAIGRTRR